VLVRPDARLNGWRLGGKLGCPMSRFRLRRALGVMVALALILCMAAAVGLYAAQRHLIYPGQFTMVTRSPVL
jgi:hypothetical protein